MASLGIFYVLVQLHDCVCNLSYLFNEARPCQGKFGVLTHALGFALYEQICVRPAYDPISAVVQILSDVVRRLRMDLMRRVDKHRG
ncbi:hypothetical protein D3C85_1338360 [compost metagenome]